MKDTQSRVICSIRDAICAMDMRASAIEGAPLYSSPLDLGGTIVEAYAHRSESGELAMCKKGGTK